MLQANVQVSGTDRALAEKSSMPLFPSPRLRGPGMLKVGVHPRISGLIGTTVPPGNAECQSIYIYARILKKASSVLSIWRPRHFVARAKDNFKVILNFEDIITSVRPASGAARCLNRLQSDNRPLVLGQMPQPWCIAQDRDVCPDIIGLHPW
jgi:hypothetical protein